MTVRDDNFEDFISNWPSFRGRLVVFLGAGASIGARNTAGDFLPNAYQLRNDIWKKYKWSESDGDFNPDSLRLMGLEHAAAIIESRTGRQVLSEHLISTFTCNRPLWQHAMLPHLRPVSLFTTNYDELIELGYQSSVTTLDVICNNRLPVQGRTALYKPHGSLSHANQRIGDGGLVITQFDYFEMISQYRIMLRKAMTDFSTSCVVVIGYSFGDMDIGSELYSIRKENDNIPWYAVFPRADPQVRNMYARRFGIQQIDRTFESFMAELDSRVDFIPENLKHRNMDNLRVAGMVQ